MLRRHVGRRLHLPLEPILELPWAAFALSSEHPLATKLRQPIASKIRANSSNSTDTWIHPKKLKHSQNHNPATTGEKLKQPLARTLKLNRPTATPS